ncbi:hypothetical protein H5410_001078 [Solanum commersonii]|uniref:F-box domain-containing protein n=1 Tax=Solanum commersonii TaxID=4109 RepID=A0A9J6AY90_SOLCO|nr:hypothetical protein H5410_001078 [Solanum commersonii]
MLISDPSWWKKQKEDGKSSSSILQIESFGELPFHIHVLSSVNDLFLLWQPFSVQPAKILNPSTIEVKFLPNLKEDFSLCHYSLGFKPKENKYKVLSTAKYDQEGYIKSRVFTLGIDESWRETKSIPLPIFAEARHLHQWTAFDVKAENSKLIELVDESQWWHYELIEVKSKLGILVYEKRLDGHIHLRVLGETQKKDEWESHTIQFPSTWKDIQPDVISSCTSGDGEILFTVNVKSGILYLCYDITRQSWRTLEIKGLPKNECIEGICSYVMKMKFSIPDEIMFEIFSWLPVKSLMCFKCVSGLCNSLIFESDCIWEPYSVRPVLIFNPSTR